MKQQIDPLTPPKQPADGSDPEMQVRHPGTQKPVFGNAHSHPDASHEHMGFTGPTERTGFAHTANIHSADMADKPKHVIPQGTFGSQSVAQTNHPGKK